MVGSLTRQHITFEAGYRPCIVVTPENSYLETSPGNTTVMNLITVENLGNG